MKPYDIHPDAEDEYYDAVRRHAEFSRKTGLKCIEEFEAALQRIREFPEMGSPAEDDALFRVFHFRTLPYGIVYSYDGEKIYVVAMAHHSREKGYWKNRG